MRVVLEALLVRELPAIQLRVQLAQRAAAIVYFEIKHIAAGKNTDTGDFHFKAPPGAEDCGEFFLGFPQRNGQRPRWQNREVRLGGRRDRKTAPQAEKPISERRWRVVDQSKNSLIFGRVVVHWLAAQREFE